MRLRVPASSANLGPGFDCFGIAWQLWNEIEFEPNDRLVITGCPERYQNPQNLAYDAYRTVLAMHGVEAGGVTIRFGRTDIPVSRGLGSSSALLIAGALAANELGGLDMTRDELFRAAVRLEGHPDNVAPAFFGGFTVSAMDGDRICGVGFPVSDSLCFTVLIPDFELSTRLARQVLPETYARADAIFNTSHASLMLHAMQSGDCGVLSFAIEDRIHQPYRTALIPGYDEARQLALEAGAAAVCISGAGSTMLCISDRPGLADRLAAPFAERFPGWRVKDVQPDREGAKIL